MSLSIQELPPAVAAASPVEPVPLSERVQARQPRPTTQVAEEQAPPREDEVMLAPDALAADTSPAPAPAPALALEQALLSLPRPDAATVPTPREAPGRQGQHIGHPDLRTVRKPPQAGAATPVLPGNASRPTPAVANPPPAVLPGKHGATPSADIRSPGSAGTQRQTPALQAVPANGGAVLPNAGVVVPSTSTPPRSPSAPASPAATTAAPAAGVATDALTDALDAAAAPVEGSEPSAVPDASSTVSVTNTAAVPQQPSSDAAPDSQSMADARRAEANLGTRQHVRAARQAEALQTARVQRADTASHFNVSFNSWGSGHSVSARLEGGRLHMQPSSARVGQALSSALAPPGAELEIAVDTSDNATDERRRRGGQGHA